MAGLRAFTGVWPALLLVFIVLQQPVTSRAQENDEARDNALARALFDEGIELSDRGEWVGAADRFGRVYALKPTPQIAFNWASALIETGRFLEAQELLLSAQHDANASEQLKRECGVQLSALMPRIGRARVHVRGGSARSSVELDGKRWPQSAWDISSPLDPGEHSVRLRDGDAELAHQTFTLREGELRELTLDASQHTTAPHDSASGRPLYKNWVLWTAVGVLAVGGVVAGIVIAAHKDERAEPLVGNAMPGMLRW